MMKYVRCLDDLRWSVSEPALHKKWSAAFLSICHIFLDTITENVGRNKWSIMGLSIFQFPQTPKCAS